MIDATLAIIVKDARVLLGDKHPGVEEISGILNGPGGKQEPGETLVQCLIRETRDEMGIELIADRLKKIAVITCFAGARPDIRVHVYWTDTFNGVPQKTEAMTPGWYPLEQIPYERMLEGDRLWFPLALSGEEKFGARVYYKNRAKGFIEMVMDAFPENAV